MLPNSSTSLWGNSCYDSNDGTINGTSNPYSGALQWNGGPAPSQAQVGNTTATSGPPSSASILTVGPSPNYNTGANGILCEANQQLNKTGTMMLAAPEPAGSSAPQNVTDTLQGNGYQAIFLGVLL